MGLVRDAEPLSCSFKARLSTASPERLRSRLCSGTKDARSQPACPAQQPRPEAGPGRSVPRPPLRGPAARRAGGAARAARAGVPAGGRGARGGGAGGSCCLGLPRPQGAGGGGSAGTRVSPWARSRPSNPLSRWATPGPRISRPLGGANPGGDRGGVPPGVGCLEAGMAATPPGQAWGGGSWSPGFRGGGRTRGLCGLMGEAEVREAAPNLGSQRGVRGQRAKWAKQNTGSHAMGLFWGVRGAL